MASYAVVLRILDGMDEPEILLSRLSARVTPDESWTLPGGGIKHGEDPRRALVREVREETSLEVTVGPPIQVQSSHWSDTWREGRRVDAQALRLIFEGWVAKDAPPPRTLEVDGSTMDAAWHPVSAVTSGALPVVEAVSEALAGFRPRQRQRIAAYGLIRSEEKVLLTRISARGYHAGAWTLPGGGVEHGEAPADALRRELTEECGVTAGAVGTLLGVHDEHFTGTAPDGRLEDYHGVHLVFVVNLDAGSQPRVVEVGGTTDSVAWVKLADILDGSVRVLDVVRYALAHA